MIHLFEGNSADEVWRLALAEVHTGSHTMQQPSRGGPTRELLHGIFSIRDPRQRWVVSREPAINPAFAIAEVIWIMGARNDAHFLNFWNSQLSRFAGSEAIYHGAYGHRLRKHFHFDQLEQAYQALRNNPGSRQVVLQIWDPVADFPHDDGTPANTDIPCNIVAVLKIRQNKLEWTQINRSNDLFLGVPHNFIQFTCIQEILAGWLEIEVGEYHHLSDSLHLYERDAEKAYRSQAIEIAPNTDSLCLPKERSEAVFRELVQQSDQILKPELSTTTLRGIISGTDLPTAYYNWICILGAEAARRNKWPEVAEFLAAECTNPALKQVWGRWISRVQD